MKALLTAIALLSTAAGWSQPNRSFSIYFDTDKHTLDIESTIQLDSFIKAQDLNPFTVKLSGYCDETGTSHYNNILSARRANTVKEYLDANGMNPTFIIGVSGHGERMPVNANKTPEERALNRRVDISLIDPVGKFGDDEPSLLERIRDSSVSQGTYLVLNNIHFEGASHEFLDESYYQLQTLESAMKAYPSLVIEIQGHICCQPGDNDGLDIATGLNNLSVARAKAIYDYLVANGIDSARISYKGFGHSRPIYPYPEKTEQEKIANRRVEIKILSK